ncbi:hypothetical protein AVEN_255717-1 [Araneus ventricosus]|uniref:Uncharacterized protein n=1 Tax=Araneus ventricosus TaxID=182803 RepID=A0A4Y2PPI7_ARAVE|nr:hypothetical protein AVEN_255717-1 [Araneus ventricosus]
MTGEDLQKFPESRVMRITTIGSIPIRGLWTMIGEDLQKFPESRVMGITAIDSIPIRNLHNFEKNALLEFLLHFSCILTHYLGLVAFTFVTLVSRFEATGRLFWD